VADPQESHTISDQAAAALPRSSRWSIWRVAFLLLSGLCLYVFAPSIGEVFEAWDRLGEVHPLAVIVLLALEGASLMCVWLLQRIALRTSEWFSVITSQLAGNAFNRITPGGGATGTALQVRMLADAGFDTTHAASAITIQSLLITAALVALPIFAIPAIVFAGVSVPGSLADGIWIGLGVFVLMAVLGVLFLSTRAPLQHLGDLIERMANFRRSESKPRIVNLGERLLAERDAIRETMGNEWLPAVGNAVGRWAFEYFALLVTLYAIGASPEPWLVLIAFVAAAALGMLPFTPGGLGFVEAGLTGALALSGVNATEAVLATLVFRLVTFWLPLPIGAVSAIVFRRRYGHPRHNQGVPTIV
jgi:uncharacterized protein (TIRG00374 family)